MVSASEGCLRSIDALAPLVPKSKPQVVGNHKVQRKPKGRRFGLGAGARDDEGESYPLARSLARFLLWFTSPLFNETDEDLTRWLTLHQSGFEEMVGLDQLAGQQLMVFVVCVLLTDPLGEDWKEPANAHRLARALKASGCSDYVRICGEAWLPWPVT